LVGSIKIIDNIQQNLKYVVIKCDVLILQTVNYTFHYLILSIINNTQ
jgi:hypothetical protein